MYPRWRSLRDSGVRNTSEVKSRPASGRLLICSLSTVVPTVLLVTSTSGTSAVTVTTSAVWAMGKVKSTVGAEPSTNRTFCSSVANPGMLAVTT